MSGDVTFTYTNSQGQSVTKTLLWADRIASRESLGIWHVDSQAWKVFSQTTQYDKLSADYRRAAVDAGLPMGSPSFQQGTVRRGTASPTQGFVLKTNWMTGVNFVHTAAAFEAALKTANFPKAKTSQDYIRMQRGASAANKVGLRDPQGFLKAGLSEPLCFVDVHTSWNAVTQKYGFSAAANEILQMANAWGV